MIVTSMTKAQILKTVQDEIMDASFENDFCEMSEADIEKLADKLSGLAKNLNDIIG